MCEVCKMETLRKQAGVTLIELMTSLSVIAVLLTLSVPSFSDFVTKREIAGTANLVASFFETVKMESIKRHEFISVSYKKAANGPEWCLGAVVGKDTACDCMSITAECLIDSAPMILSNDSYTQFSGMLAGLENGMISYDPIRGVLTDPAATATITLQHSEEDYQVKVSINATGRVSKCTPADYKLVGYATCI